jgi:hypothetical protein
MDNLLLVQQSRLKVPIVGTVTDLDGNFQLNVPANAVLLVSYVGYKEY